MKHKRITDLNTATYHIMSSDDDQPIVQDLCVGFNSRGELIVSIVNECYEDERYICSTWAVVSRDEARKLARRLKVAYPKLHIFIGDCMAEWSEIINPTFSQVQDCFKEITECLLDDGCRFRIMRTYGPHGFMCC